MPHHLEEEKLVFKAADSKSILFGEDDIDDEELLQEIFSSVDNSLTLTFINNGKKLVDYLDAVPDHLLPCLVVLDYNMPELDGAAILEKLKYHMRYANVPKLIWSTSQTETFKKKCLELGADNYITKPSKVSELVETVRYMLSLCR